MNDELTTQLAEYGEQTRAAQGTLTVADVMERAETVRPLSQGQRERQISWGRTVGIVFGAAALVILVVAVPNMLSRTDQQPDPVTDTPSTTIPTSTTVAPTTVAPPTSAAETPTTLVPSVVGIPGTVSWTEHGPAPIADPFSIVSTPFGFAAMTRGSSGFQMWKSDDGAEWSEASVPPMDSVDAVIHSGASGVWLSGDDDLDPIAGVDPLEIWHSPDLVEWELVHLGEFPQATFGLRANTRVEDVVSAGGATLALVAVDMEFDWATILGLQPDDYSDSLIVEFDETRNEPDVYAVIIKGPEPDDEDAERIDQLVAEVRFEDGQSGFRIVDNVTGRELIFFPRGTEPWVGYGVPDDGLFGLTEGGWSGRFETLVMIRPDGTRIFDYEVPEVDSLEYCWQALSEVGGQMLVGVCAEDDVATTFVSPDGVSWSPGPRPTNLVGYDYDPDSGYWYGYTFGMSGSTHWISPDGDEWTMLEPGSSDYARLLRLDGGWVVVDQNWAEETENGVFVSIDGEVWTANPGVPPGTTHGLGNTIVVFGEDVTWIGVVTFDAS